MDEDSERDDAQVEHRLTDGDFIAPGHTVLEPGGGQELDAAWRPSRPSVVSTGSTSGEVAPFSATGVHTGRVGFVGLLSRWRFAGLGAGLALVLGVGALWLARPVPPESEAVPSSELAPATAVAPAAQPAAGAPAQEPASELAAPERAAAAGDETSEPRVTPIAAPSSRVQTRAYALKPAAGLKPAPRTGGEGQSSSGSSEASKSIAGVDGDVDWSDPNPPAGPAPARAASPRGGTDPWNPDSFGDRR
jgi:hypothetical protein